jgi:hypothetical protein
MFSFPRPGCVRTGTQGYAFVFGSTTGESYLFLRNIGVGAQSTAQLVVNTNPATPEVVVRKVSQHKLPLNSSHDLTKLRPDREVRILAHLNAILRNPAEPIPASFTPRWTNCISHEDLPVFSPGPNPKLECARVGYWKLCNGGTLGDWLWGGVTVPVSIVARCVAQVSETLHVMYTAGPECVFHCDLHLHNVFVHFEVGSPGQTLPDFYLGDFGLARTAGEPKSDIDDMYGEGPLAALLESPPLGVASVNQRRRWDMDRLLRALTDVFRFPVPDIGNVLGPQAPPTPPTRGKQALVLNKQETGLQRLMMMLKFIDSQDRMLAAHNARSRPPSLVEVVREARKLEAEALAIEQEGEEFKSFMATARERADAMARGGPPFVFMGGQGLPPARRKALAEKHGDLSIEGPWSVIESE